jgi:arylformamidase
MVEQLSGGRFIGTCTLRLFSPSAPARRRNSSASRATSPRRDGGRQTAELIVGSGYNHFELLETLANPYGLTGRAMLAQMQLTK